MAADPSDPSGDTPLLGRHGPEIDRHGFVNPPIHRGSTVRFPDLESFEGSLEVDLKDGPFTYGLLGTPVERELESMLADLEGGAGSVLLGSGLAAVGVSLLAHLGSGDHLLMVDSCYAPSRIICSERLAALGIETTFYDPTIGAGIEALIRPNTRVLFMESPGSLTFEVQDVRTLVEVAARHELVTIADNTWGTPLLFNPISLGVDVVVHALTKYVSGHSDVMLGAVVAAERSGWERLKTTAMDLGQGASPDDAWLALRGMRTLPLRLRHCAGTAMELAKWLDGRAEVDVVLHPAFEDTPGHAFWKRDFRGAAGLFSIVMGPTTRSAFKSFVEGLEHFSLGYSWGGFESLVLPFNPRDRSNQIKFEEGVGLRLSIGLECGDDLIADLEAGFGRLAGSDE